MTNPIQRNPALATALRWGTALLLPLLVAETTLSAPATRPSDAIVSAGVSSDGHVNLIVNRSTTLVTRSPIAQVSVGAPDIADVNVVGLRSILVTAKKPGQTQIIVWDKEDHTQTIDVEVASDLKQLADHLKSLLPGTTIDVSNAGGSIVLKGRVPDLQSAEQAAQIAAPYGQKVLNFLEVAGGQQVMLQVKFAEVSRSASSALGINFGFTDGRSFGGSNVGQVSPLALQQIGTAPGLAVPSPSASVTLFGQGQLGNTAINGLLSALRSNNLLRILAQPNLTAISGQEASFLAGGEFPVPVPQGGAGTGGSVAITVDYREFGVRLSFVPVVLGDGRIRLKVAPEVSDLDFSSGLVNQGFRIPIINKRKVNTTIELAEGQTFAIAGLMNHQVSASSDTTPGLGDLPVIGALFRSVRYQRDETELLVLVTPYLVEGMSPEQVPTSPGEKWRHPTENQLFWNNDTGGPDKSAPAATKEANTQPDQFKGEYGFQPAAQ
ncbi:MAG TPA: type II and III secretion system protein family protein [Tepidisphaeraceae bacterium]|jgi:pilus assembly protein CpaC|nr:type II and III secretion system protein family protein [Tepidisphaeraceae bacterium]